MLQNLPNIITLGNLLLGCIGILYVKSPELAVACLYGAALLDFFDGMVARLLNAQSAIGKDLDSLADVVSFGVLPGFMAYHQLNEVIGESPFLFICFLIPVLSALRLARFNHDTRQTDRFIGLPTPANGMMIAALYYFHFSNPSAAWLQNEYLLGLFFLASALLLNSRIELIALKFKTFGFKGNEFRWILILLSIPLLLLLKLSAPLGIIPLFVLVSLAQNIYNRTTS